MDLKGLRKTKLEEHIDKVEVQKYTVGLLLGIAYSASIGGIATLVGTPPNLSFAALTAKNTTGDGFITGRPLFSLIDYARNIRSLAGHCQLPLS